MYWKNRPESSATDSLSSQSNSASRDRNRVLSEFDLLRQSRLLEKGGSSSTETWGAEVRRYLNELEEDVTKDTDIVKWWQVRNIFLLLVINN